MILFSFIGGGLTAVIYIDVVQVFIMIAGSSVLLFKGLNEVGGWDALQTKYMQAVPNRTFINPGIWILPWKFDHKLGEMSKSCLLENYLSDSSIC